MAAAKAGTARPDGRSGTKRIEALTFTERKRLNDLPGIIERLEAEIAKVSVLLDAEELFTKEPVKFRKASEILADRQAQTAPAATARPASFEQDRQSILAQAGQFKVRFDFQENVSFHPGYDPVEAHISGGNEIVRLVEDTGDREVPHVGQEEVENAEIAAIDHD